MLRVSLCVSVSVSVSECERECERECECECVCARVCERVCACECECVCLSVCVVKVSFVFSEAHALNGNKRKQRERGGSLSDTQWERETQGGENKKETQLGR